MTKLTKAQKAIAVALREPYAKLEGDFITKKWTASWQDGGFRPSLAVRDVTVRALLSADIIEISNVERARAYQFVYKLK